MKDPARTLLGQVEREVGALAGAGLFPGAGSDAASPFEAHMGLPPPPGLAAFLAAPDGGVLAPEGVLLGLGEAAKRRGSPEGGGGTARVPAGPLPGVGRP